MKMEWEILDPWVMLRAIDDSWELVGLERRTLPKLGSRCSISREKVKK